MDHTQKDIRDLEKGNPFEFKCNNSLTFSQIPQTIYEILEHTY